MSIWGRVIGGAAGFALGGPIGAILGVRLEVLLTEDLNQNHHLTSIE